MSVDQGKLEAVARLIWGELHADWDFGDAVDEFDMERWDTLLSEALGEEPHVTQDYSEG